MVFSNHIAHQNLGFETNSSDDFLNKAGDSTPVFGYTIKRSPLHTPV